MRMGLQPPNDGGARQAQRGVVLIIALILLVIISLLAVTSVRNASSSEIISGTVRTSELAYQAAEIALRHCEASATKIVRNNAVANTSTYTTTITAANIVPVGTNAWQTTATWDSGTSTNTYVVTSLTGTVTYQRQPECSIELLTTNTIAATAVPPVQFVVTARGFGPEVASGTGRPKGSVVWLQSTIEVP